MSTWPKDRDLFARELVDILELIAGAPAIGAEYRTRSGKAASRVLMPKTRTHVYFEVDRPRDLITILAVWGAPRGKGPAL